MHKIGECSIHRVTDFDLCVDEDKSKLLLYGVDFDLGPYATILFDEIKKEYSNILNIFLYILNDGFIFKHDILGFVILETLHMETSMRSVEGVLETLTIDPCDIGVRV